MVATHLSIQLPNNNLIVSCSRNTPNCDSEARTEEIRPCAETGKKAFVSSSYGYSEAVSKWKSHNIPSRLLE